MLEVERMETIVEVVRQGTEEGSHEFGVLFRLTPKQTTNLIERVCDPSSIPVGEDALEEIQTTALRELFREAIEQALGFAEVKLELVAQDSRELAPSQPNRRDVIRAFGEVWQSQVGVPSFGRIGKALRPILDSGEPIEVVAQAWVSYLSNEDGKYVSPEAFASRYVSIRDGRYGSGGKTVSDWGKVLDDLISACGDDDE